MIDAEYMEMISARVADIEQSLADPATLSNRDRYRELLTEHAHLKSLQRCGDSYIELLRERENNQSLVDDAAIDPELKELAEEELVLLAESLPAAERALRLSLLPPDPDENRNIIMEIRAGTGGDEAAIFAGDLHRMYARYAEQMDWNVSIIYVSATELGGYKEIIFSVEGENVYRLLRYESGGHRVQRIPSTEAQGRIHTSAATVAVLPEAAELDEIEIRSDDLRIDTYRASGAGGQHVNKTDSAVRITHEPTGLVVQSQDERSQHRNKEKAMRVLRARMLDMQRKEEEAKLADARRSQIGSGDRSQRIRTYNFPQNRVTDHRINLTLYSLDRLMEGNLGELLAALVEQDMEMRLQVELKEQVS
jgi:peptide chain release factor 1